MNKKLILLLGIIVSGVVSVAGQNVFSIEEIIERAKQQSIFSKQAETQKETSYWQYRSFKTNYNPQLRLNGNLPTYTNYVTPVIQPDGTKLYLPVNQFNPNINLGLQQPIGTTGGIISANTSYNFFNDIAADINQWSGTVMNIELRQPIFAYNPLKWDKRI
ncbi:MAG: hypothetical protein JNL53_16390, partial [Cyclobacteriaceae bacterium]|nr:hypothetical protein [Cyclobacteriaceae bacterium]